MSDEKVKAPETPNQNLLDGIMTRHALPHVRVKIAAAGVQLDDEAQAMQALVTGDMVRRAIQSRKAAAPMDLTKHAQTVVSILEKKPPESVEADAAVVKTATDAQGDEELSPLFEAAGV